MLGNGNMAAFVPPKALLYGRFTRDVKSQTLFFAHGVTSSQFAEMGSRMSCGSFLLLFSVQFAKGTIVRERAASRMYIIVKNSN